MKRKLNRKPPPGNVRWVGSTGQNMRGIITNKAGRLVQFESWAERALLLRLDRDPEVKDYGSQPETFEYVDDQGRTRHYTPDFIVWRSAGIEIHEVTRSERRTQLRLHQREKAGAEICAARGWRYLVHTEGDLPQGAELANLLALARYRSTGYADPGVTKLVFEQLGQGQAIDLSTLVGQMAAKVGLPEPHVLAALGHLLWHGQLCTDLDRLIFEPDRGRSAPSVRVWLAAALQEGKDVSQTR
ncbi:MAG: hypothetical protein BroJett011_43150 [Chloroflexota bacterium]|nr:MAG: hypothetical protein BroJett011_43150 [Chloroflexota bacterium]